MLETPEASEIKIKDGLALVWLSHENTLGLSDATHLTGASLGSEHDIFNGLEVRLFVLEYKIQQLSLLQRLVTLLLCAFVLNFLAGKTMLWKGASS